MTQRKRLIELLRAFPGIDAARLTSNRLTIRFKANVDGAVAELVWLRIAERYELVQSKPSTWLVADERIDPCARTLSYATAAAFRVDATSPKHPSSKHSTPNRASPRSRGRVATDASFFRNLVVLYHSLENEFSRRAGFPFNVWANALRVLGRGPIGRADLSVQCVLSDRALRVALRDLESLGWIAARTKSRIRQISLTPAGRRQLRNGDDAVKATSALAENKLGKEPSRQLHELLACVLSSLAYELPWGLTGYGPGDSSLTGGGYVPAKREPHFIPAHGAEWPVALRRNSPYSDEPLVALLAKTLARFVIDYSDQGLGSLLGATSYQHFPNEGIPLTEAKAFGVTGTGRSGPERHLYVVTPIGSGKSRSAFLTPKGQAERDGLAQGLTNVEMHWRSEIGHETFDALVSAAAEGRRLLTHRETDGRLHPCRWFNELHNLSRKRAQ